jgi:hypothetical protein
MRDFKNRTKMRLRPDVLLMYIIILCSIFGTAALAVSILVSPDWIKAISVVIIFFLGWTAAKYHSKL